MTAPPRRLLMTTDAVGGVWQYSLELARALVSHGYETTLALTGPAPSATQRAVADAIFGVSLIDTGVGLDWLAADAAAIAAAGHRIAGIAADVRADLVQLNAPSLASGVRFPAPVVAVTHSCLATWWHAVEGSALPHDFAWRAAVMADGLHAASAVVAPSAALARATKLAYGLPTQPLVVHNGRTPPEPASARLVAGSGVAGTGAAGQGAADSKPFVHASAFTAGRLWDRGKDVATLDRAAARMMVPLIAAGPICGPNRETARFDYIDAIGVLDDAALLARLATRPVFVSAARYEPFGLAVLEAAAAGCALVLADIPTFRELWDGVAQFVRPGDDHGFAEAIETIVGDSPRRLALGSAAEQRALRYTPAVMAAEMAAIYDLALTKPVRGDPRCDTVASADPAAAQAVTVHAVTRVAA